MFLDFILTLGLLALTAAFPLLVIYDCYKAAFDE